MFPETAAGWVRTGSAFMAAAVMIGAFGAHALKTRLTAEMHQVFEVGVRYHLIHGLAIFVVAWVSTMRDGPLPAWSGRCFVAGILFFSGSLYGYALSGVSRLAAFAPIGGSLFIAGWIILLLAARRP